MADDDAPRKAPTFTLASLLLRALTLLGYRRPRIHLAILLALAVISLLAFTVLPVREVTVAADGTEITVTTRADSDEVLLRLADVELLPGDRVKRTQYAGGEVLAVERATPVVLEVDGRLLGLRTRSATIAGALAEANVKLGPRDSVLQNDVFVSPYDAIRPPPRLAALLPVGSADSSDAASGTESGPVSIEVRRAVPFTVHEDGQTLHFESSRTTVGLGLKEAGVQLGPGDSVQPSPATELAAGLEIHVEHAEAVTVTLPGSKIVLYTLTDTVGEALAEAGIALPEDSRLEPPAETAITVGMFVHVIRVSEELLLEEEYLESSTVYKPDSSLPPGETRRVEGHDGVLYRQYRILYENDVAVTWELVEEWYQPEPVDTVVYYSTATESAPSEIGGGMEPPASLEGYEVLRTMRVYATWYCPASAGRSSTDPWYGITATGVPVTQGIVAVDPNVIPLGTRMYIPGYGFGVAADTGGGISGNMIDLGYPDGVIPDWISHWVDIYILAP